MQVRKIGNRAERRLFYKIPRRIYRGNPCHRSTEDAITHLLIDGPTTYHRHATVEPCLLWENEQVVGRCALIHDRKLPDYAQVAFFEAMPGLEGVCDTLVEAARSLRSGARKLVIGLNGHLNYGAGFLLNHFDEPPVFGLPYTPPYYADYFRGLPNRESVSFRIPLKEIYAWVHQSGPNVDTQGIRVRFLNRRELRRDIELYTYIDNAAFSASEPRYWSNREPEENYELFHPFRYLLKDEDLVFAEKEGEPAGFLLWYPDFNSLVPATRDIGPLDVLCYRLRNSIRTVRLAEVAVMPKFQRSPVVAAMLLQSLLRLEQTGYEICEGGFIFSDNRNSIAMTRRYAERGHGYKMQPYRRYGMFEADLC